MDFNLPGVFLSLILLLKEKLNDLELSGPGTIMGVDPHPPKGPKSLAQGAQEPGHLPKAVGQVVQVSGHTNHFHFQPSCTAEVVHESHQEVTSLPLQDDQEGEASWLRKQNGCGCGDHNRWRVCLKVCALRTSG